MNSLQGLLLVASPDLTDPNFRQTIVFIVRHTSEEGTLGLVLNRQTSTTIKELWERLGEGECTSDAPLSLGGPCEGPLMALHTVDSAAEIQVLPGIYFSAGGEQMRLLISGNPGTARFFFGYAGWGAGQLEQELQAGAWRMEPATLRHIFSLHQEQWERSISEAAGWEVLSALNLKSVPIDPSQN